MPVERARQDGAGEGGRLTPQAPLRASRNMCAKGQLTKSTAARDPRVGTGRAGWLAGYCATCVCVVWVWEWVQERGCVCVGVGVWVWIIDGWGWMSGRMEEGVGQGVLVLEGAWRRQSGR